MKRGVSYSQSHFDNCFTYNIKMLNTIDIVRVERREKKAVGEEIRKFLLPISPVQYNKAFVGVRTTFLLVLKQIV